MDNKNVFIAIALSMSVLLFWAAFFETPQQTERASPQKQEKKVTENNITPNINQNLKDKTIPRVEAINKSKKFGVKTKTYWINFFGWPYR